MKCLICKRKTKNPKFCSLRCNAISQNNSRKKTTYHCQFCHQIIGKGWKYKKKKYCPTCFKENSTNYKDWTKITLKHLFSKLDNHKAHARIRALARQIFTKKGIRWCEECGYNKHFEVCHIKSIKNFDLDTPISVVNSLDNLKALCPNHHWEFDNIEKGDLVEN